MVILCEDEINKLKRYAKEEKYVSVALIQNEFDWSYAKARKGVEKLVERELLKLDNGIFYTYVDGDEEQCDEWDDFDDEDSEESDDEDEDTDRGYDSFNRFLRDRRALSFDIKAEEKVIAESLEMMNKLESAANNGKRKLNENYKPKNTKLPDEYVGLPQESKDLVNFVIKNASKLSGARVGLFEGSKRWDRLSWGSVNYDIAIKFIGGLTDAEFKRIKYILTDC